MEFLLFLIVFFFGGISSLSFVGAAAYLFFQSVTSPIPSNETANATAVAAKDDASELPPPDEKTLRKLKNEPGHDLAAGYFAVTREFVPGGINGKPPERVSPVGTNAKTDDSSPSMYQAMVRSIFDRKQGSGSGSKGVRRGNNIFYVVLRHGCLMLYDDSDQVEVRHVISLNHHTVSIYGGGEEIPEGELFIRRNAVCLSRKDIAGTPESVTNNASLTKPFFFFAENCSEKEDFYFALLRNQEKSREDDSEPPSPLLYESHHLISLIQQLHSSEEHLQTRWINAIVGRVFLSIYKTTDVSDFIKSKIVKKIARVKKPAFLGDIIIQKVDVGEAAPFITNPRLRDLNVNGELAVECDISYNGNARIEVATSVKIDLGQRFKTREVGLILSVCVKKLEGHTIIKVKAPPSNRLWFTFETMPELKVVIEPVVSTRQITFQPILTLIENRIREVIAETVVYPHFDDIPFTDTFNQQIRGGIWAVAKPSTEILTGRGEEKGVAEEETLRLFNSPGSDNKNSLSMPNLPQTLPNFSKREPSIPGKATEDSTSESNVSISNGLRNRLGSDLKPKSMRASSFSSLTAATPLVSTDAVNVTAVRESLNKKSNIGGAKSMVQATMERSRSQSISKSAHSSPVGSPSNYSTSVISNSSLEGEAETEEQFYPAPEEALIEEVEAARKSRSHSTSSATTSSSSTTKLPLTPVNISGGSSQTTLPPVLRQTHNESSSTMPIMNAAQNGGKLTAVTNAAAAMKKWYKGRQENNEESRPPGLPSAHDSMLNLSRSSSSSGGTRYIPKLPPPEIPPPPAKKTAPIAMPKRKPLPPPLLPPRNKSDYGDNNNSSKRHAPSLPQRNGGGVDDVLVVAAPVLSESEPGTPGTPQSELPSELIVGTDDETYANGTAISRDSSSISGTSSSAGSAVSSGPKRRHTAASHRRTMSTDKGKVEEKEKSKDDRKVNWKKTVGIGLSVGVRDGWYNEER